LVVECVGSGHSYALIDPIGARVPPRYGDGLRVVISGEDRCFGQCPRCRDRQNARPAAKVENTVKRRHSRQSIDGQQATQRRRVVRCAECLGSIY
jgi:hypothetical protein